MFFYNYFILMCFNLKNTFTFFKSSLMFICLNVKKLTFILLNQDWCKRIVINDVKICGNTPPVPLKHIPLLRSFLHVAFSVVCLSLSLFVLWYQNMKWSNWRIIYFSLSHHQSWNIWWNNTGWYIIICVNITTSCWKYQLFLKFVVIKRHLEMSALHLQC